MTTLIHSPVHSLTPPPLPDEEQHLIQVMDTLKELQNMLFLQEEKMQEREYELRVMIS